MSTPEDLYKEKFEGYAPQPPQSVWSGVERRLRWREFMTFGIARPNIYYAAAAAGALICTGYSLIGGNDAASEPIAISTPASPRTYAGAPASGAQTAMRTHAAAQMAGTAVYMPEATADCAYIADSAMQEASAPDDSEYMAMLTPQASEPEMDTAAEWAPSAAADCNTRNMADTQASAPEMNTGIRTEANIRTLGQNAVMEAVHGSSNVSFAWDFGDGQSAVGQRTMHRYAKPGTYTVRLVTFSRAQDIQDTITREVCIAAPQYSITFPNAQVASLSEQGFAPKGDVGELISYNLVIYSRNGQEVFRTESAHQGWNGYYKGDRLPKGVYVYRASYSFSNGDRDVTSGSITLMWEENTNLIIHP